jgi:hypothetical protein
MNYKGVLKRLLPFAATFFVAVFITSFFVDLSAPRFGNWRARGWERHRMYERVMCENEQLKNENLRLRNELENRRTDETGAYGSGSGSGIGSGYGGGSSSMEGLRLMVPAPQMAPPAPVAPRVLKFRHSGE